MRRTAVGLLAILALWVGVGPALAHADLVGSNPASGATLATAPTQIILTFGERVDAALSRVSVQDTRGAGVAVGATTSVAAQPRQLSVPLPPHLPDGVYTVDWRAVSSDDGHVTVGAFAFGVGTKPGATPSSIAPPAAPGPSVLGVTGKILLYAGLAVLFAAAVVGSIAFGGNIPARRAVFAVASSAALAGAAAMLFDEHRAVGAGFGTLLRSSVGGPYLWLLGIVAATAAASTWAETARSRWALPTVGLGASAAMFVRAAGGHAAGARSSSWIQIGAQWIHFMSVGVWIGGLVLVAVLLRSGIGSTDGSAPVVEIRRFSAMAFWAVLLLAITGAIRTLNELGGISAVRRLLDSSYGITLTVKVALVFALVALGAVNRYRALPGLVDGGRLLRRVIGAELITSVALLGLTATLTSLPPAAGSVPAPPQVSVSLAAGQPDIYTSTLAGGVQLRSYIYPGTAGPSQFHVTAFESDGTELPLASATLSATPAGGNLHILVSTRLSAGHFVANTTLAAGTWRFGIRVTTADGHTLQATFNRTIEAAPAA